MFAALGRLVVRRPWWVIGAWIVLAVLVIGLAPKLTSTTDEASFLPSGDESLQAQALQQTAFPHNAAPAAILAVQRQDGAALTTADLATVADITAKLTALHIPNVTALAVSPPSANRRMDLIAAQMPAQTGPGDTRQTDAVSALRPQFQQLLAGTDLVGGIAGTAAQNLDQTKSGNSDEKIVALTTVLLILVLLLIIFRSPIIALLPLLVIGLVSQVADGLIAWTSNAFDLKIDSSVTSLLIVVLFGVGTDYILFLMFRYRERLRAGEDPKTAMVSAVTRVGEAIASAAGAVIVAFLALALSTLGLFKSLGPALAIAVAMTLLAGLTLVPAIVSLLGTKVFWPSKAWRAEPTGARFNRIGSALGRRPVTFALGSGGVLVLLAIAALGFHPTFDLTAGTTAGSSESTVWNNRLTANYSAGASQPSEVLVRSTSGHPLDASALAAYRTKLAAVPGVGQVSAPVLSPDKTVADLSVTLTDAPASSAAIATVKGPLRGVAHAQAPPGTTALVGGVTAVFVDVQAAQDHDYAVVFPVAAVIIMLILGLVLRSLVAPWYLIASVGLGFVATLGATVLVFQDFGHASGLIFILPLVMYLFVVALGTDYNILMITRLREEARRGATPREAAAVAVRHAGPTIAAAGVILAGTFASLMLAGNSTLTQMGFAIFFGIVVAAFVMAMFFTPAVTALIGHGAWWPGHADRGRPSADDEAGPGEPELVSTGPHP